VVQVKRIQPPTVDGQPCAGYVFYGPSSSRTHCRELSFGVNKAETVERRMLPGE
jgi:hypothetical protein